MINPDDIDPKAKTIETLVGETAYCIIVDGEHKGYGVIKSKNGNKRIISKEEVLKIFDMEEIRKIIQNFKIDE